MKHVIHVALVLLVMTFVVGGLTYGSVLESKFYPVLEEIVIVEEGWLGRPGSVYTFEGYIDKKRPECEPLVVSFWEELNGVLIPLTINFAPDDFAPRDQLVLRTRPDGVQGFGPWHLHNYTGQGSIVMKTLHKCHSLWSVSGTYILK